MKERHWLTLYGWPLLIIIIFLSLPVLIALLPLKKNAVSEIDYAPGVIKYKAPLLQNLTESDKSPELRRLYAPDLFASSRSLSFGSLEKPTNWEDQADIALPQLSLFPSPPAISNKTETFQSAFSKKNITVDNADSLLLPHPLREKAGPGKKYPGLYIEATGELKQFSIWSNLFANISLPPGQKPWSIQVELGFNHEGLVEYIFAEPGDCGQAFYQEIMRRLYQCLLANATEACQGAVIISYPGYADTPPLADTSSK